MRVGSGQFQYEVVPDWGRGAEIRAFGLVSGVACDSQDRVYVFIRSPQPEVLVYDPDGRLRNRWGKDLFTKPHGIWIGPDDHVFLTDTADHTVRKTTLDGKVVMTLGTPGKPGAPGMPFNQQMTVPVDLRLTADGRSLYANPVNELETLREKRPVNEIFNGKGCRSSLCG